jgi:4-hydroxy-2-oxoheptanedioate aldolase
MNSGQAVKRHGRSGESLQLIFPRESKLGFWNSIDDPWSIEIASSKYDFVIIDLEHGFRDFSSFVSMYFALSKGMEVFVRVRSETDPWVQSLLDIGVTKFVVPQIRSIAQLQGFVQRVQWPPNGHRGYHPRSRSSKMNANDLRGEIDVVPIIETEESLGLIERLLSIKEVSALYFGSYDLSVNLDLEGPGDPRILSHLAAVAARCQIAGKGFISMPVNQAQMEAAIQAGSSSFVVGVDTQMLKVAFDNLTTRE